MISGVVFDHDGTLINNLPLVVEATDATLVGAGFDRVSADETVAGMVFPTAPRMTLVAW